jgi:hypothetical protein
MRHKIFIGLLAAEALACVAFYLVKASFSGVFSTVMAFPFEQIGIGLRLLSLSSGLGNAVALILYFAVCLLPLAALLVLRKRRSLHAEDGLLALLSAALFVVLYHMVNPGIVPWTGGEMGQVVGKAILGCITYSILCGYAVLRALRLFSSGGTDKLVRYMAIMLNLLSVSFVFMVFGVCFGGLLDSIETLRSGNAGNEHLLGASYAFLVLQYIVNALPHALNVLIVFAARRLLNEMRADRYSAETLSAAERVSKLCVAALTATALAHIGFNLLQLLCAGSLMVVNASLEIPIFSIAFALAALLFTRLVAENKRLKDDNDMFV